MLEAIFQASFRNFLREIGPKIKDRTRVITIRYKITELKAYYTFILLNLLTKVGVSTQVYSSSRMRKRS